MLNERNGTQRGRLNSGLLKKVGNLTCGSCDGEEDPEVRPRYQQERRGEKHYIWKGPTSPGAKKVETLKSRRRADLNGKNEGVKPKVRRTRGFLGKIPEI